MAEQDYCTWNNWIFIDQILESHTLHVEGSNNNACHSNGNHTQYQSFPQQEKMFMKISINRCLWCTFTLQLLKCAVPTQLRRCFDLSPHHKTNILLNKMWWPCFFHWDLNLIQSCDLWCLSEILLIFNEFYFLFIVGLSKISLRQIIYWYINRLHNLLIRIT